jgi:hypothetical protein
MQGEARPILSPCCCWPQCSWGWAWCWRDGQRARWCSLQQQQQQHRGCQIRSQTPPLKQATGGEGEHTWCHSGDIAKGPHIHSLLWVQG